MFDARPTPRPRQRLLIVMLVLLAFVGISFVIFLFPILPPPATDVSPISGLLDKQAADWNSGNLEGFMTGYWNSDELTFFSGGTINKGYKAVLARYRKRYQSDGKEMGKLTFSDLEITPMGIHDATARGRWKVVTSKQTLDGLFTLTLHRFTDGWKIVHDHTSQAEPPPP